MKTPPSLGQSLLAIASLAVVFLATAVPASRAQNKWQPAHYFRAFLQRVGSTVPNSDIDMVAAEPALQGITIPFYWAVLEPTQGNYDWSRIDAALAPLPAGRRLIVEG